MVGDRRRSAQSAVALHRALLWESRWTFRDPDGIVRPLPPAYSNTNAGPTSTRDQEQDALDASIRAILQAMVDQTDSWEVFCDCFSMCLSAMYALHVPSLPAIEELIVHHLLPTPQLPQLPTTPCTRHARESKALAALIFSTGFVSDLSRAFNGALEGDPSSRLAEGAVATAPAVQTCGVCLEVFLRLGDVVPAAREGFESVWRSAEWFTTRWGLGGESFRVRPLRGDGGIGGCGCGMCG